MGVESLSGPEKCSQKSKIKKPDFHSLDYLDCFDCVDYFDRTCSNNLAVA